jgi:malate dehydrogenase (oxaloacetate-decarboxylating)
MTQRTPEQLAQASIDLHKASRGKIEMRAKVEVNSLEDLTLIYSPGVGAVSKAIAADASQADVLTWRKNTVAVISDGSAVLGLGNIGAAAALPVMEGKCAIFKRFSGIDAVPLVLNTQDPDELIRIIASLEPSFGAIQLEDISAPRCFTIEQALQDRLSIPVMHDDQHGTAIVVLAGLINALKVVGKSMQDIRVVMNGAGAAGVAIAKLLQKAGVRQFVALDRQGVIVKEREGLTQEKQWLADMATTGVMGQGLADVVAGADVLIGVSAAGAFSADLVRTMASGSIVFALANPVPEITPDQAREGGVTVLATGRSDYANQVNNALCYPGLFRGMLDNGIVRVTDEIKVAAAQAIAGFITKPTADRIVPNMFDEGLHEAVAACVQK